MAGQAASANEDAADVWRFKETAERFANTINMFPSVLAYL
jgi:hypothetical protein